MMTQNINHGYEPQSKLWKLFRSKLRGMKPSVTRDCSTYKFQSTSFLKFESHNKERLSGAFRICSAGLVIILLFPLIIFNFANISGASEIPRTKIPFQSGEKLMYKGTWGKIPAGALTLEVLPKTSFNGMDAYHLVMITKTSPRVDVIYKVRERQDSYIDTGITRSLFYRKNTISKHPRDVNVTFDWKNMQATYSNFSKKTKPVRILPGTFDPLALFYVIRLQNLKEGSTIYIPLTDGKQNIEVKAIVGKSSRMKIAGKVYNTIAITPDMRTFDYLKKVTKKSESAQLTIWVTDDDKKIPVKIRSKVGIISFDFELIPGLSVIR